MSDFVAYMTDTDEICFAMTDASLCSVIVIVRSVKFLFPFHFKWL